MEITEVADFIKSLNDDEQVQLNELLVGHSQLLKVPTCPQGYVWSSSVGACVPDVG